MSKQISCPNCHHEFDIEDVLSAEVEKKLRDEYNQRLAGIVQREREFEEKKKRENELFQERLQKEKQLLAQEIQIKARQEFREKIELLNKEAELRNQQLRSLQQKELEFEQMQKALKEKEEIMEITLHKKISEKEEEIRTQAQRLAEEKASLKIQENERLLKERMAQQELEKEKILFSTVNKIRSEEREAAELRIRELMKQMEDQKKLLEEMRRKSDQGSMQLQGEVQELYLEDMLRELFPFDQINEVGKGVRGADCIQTVRNTAGQECGRIIYESKRTQAWSESWVDKLKADMIAQNADVAIIVTQAMPREMTQFGLRNGIWVCNFIEVRSLVLALREGVIKVFQATKSQENKGDKMVMLYDYLTSNEFRQNINALREGFMAMKFSIQQERIAMEKIWKAREKQLEKVLINAAQIDGAIQGIAGSAIPELDLLGESAQDFE